MGIHVFFFCFWCGGVEITVVDKRLVRHTGIFICKRASAGLCTSDRVKRCNSQGGKLGLAGGENHPAYHFFWNCCAVRGEALPTTSMSG